MAYNVYNKEFLRLSLVDSFIHIQWSEDYQGLGNLVLVVSETERNVEIFKAGNFITRQDNQNAMIITGVDYGDNRLITVFAVSALNLLTRRIVDTTLSVSNAEQAMREAVNKYRPFRDIALGSYNGFNIMVDPPFETTYETVFDLCQNICRLTNLGMRMLLDSKNKRLIFDIYQGSARTNAIYSDIWGNLLGTTLTTSDIQYKNVALVAGQGLNDERILVLVGNTSALEFERFEMYVDARDLQQKDGEDLNAYKNRLITRGFEKLNENAKIFELNLDIPFQDFGLKFELGDIIKCNLERYNISVDIRIQGFTIKQVDNSETMTLDLGIPVLR